MKPRPPAGIAAFAALSIGLLACALWLPLRGEVVYSRYDLHDGAVPDLELHLHGNHAFGPALWAPQVELGRPAFQTGGLTQASWACFLLSRWIDDAWELHSALVLLAFVLGGLFAYGLFRELELHPAACAACALGFAFSGFHTDQGVQILYVNGAIWSMGLFWALVANLRRPSLARGVLLAWVVHSALLSAYPQQLVWAAWFGLGLLFVSFPPRGERVRRLALLALWGGLGLASAAPFLLDLAERSAAAAREPMIPRLPTPSAPQEWLLHLRELADPLWNGRTLHPYNRYHLWGVTLTPFFGAAALLAIATVRTRATAVALGFALATLLVTYSEDVYRFGVAHLGLGLSHFHPFASANAALFLLAALGFDRALRGPAREAPLAPALEAPALARPALALSVLAMPALASLGGWADERPLDARNVAVALVLALSAALVLVKRWWPVLALGALLSAAHYGLGGLAARPRDWIGRLLEGYAAPARALREAAHDGRIALVGTRIPQWPLPNTEMLHGLTSIHTYDSLPPVQFREWVRRISAEGMSNRERYFSHVTGTRGLESEDFRRAGVRVVATYEGPLDSPVLRSAGAEGALRWYEVRDPAPPQAWVPLATCRSEAGEASIPAPLAALLVPVERRTVHDEHLELAWEPRTEPGLLWVSQQHHPRWRARAGEQPLDTVRVDGLWQGVLVPPGTARVTLEFRPWIRWWWVPQLAFAAAGLGLALRFLLRRARAAPPALRPPHSA